LQSRLQPVRGKYDPHAPVRNGSVVFRILPTPNPAVRLAWCPVVHLHLDLTGKAENTAAAIEQWNGQLARNPTNGHLPKTRELAGVGRHRVRIDSTIGRLFQPLGDDTPLTPTVSRDRQIDTSVNNAEFSKNQQQACRQFDGRLALPQAE